MDLETPGTAIMDLTSIPPGTDYGIYLYDEKKTLICYSQRSGNRDEHAVCNLNQPGRYYVRVYPWTGCNDNDPYTLKVTYPTPA
ncbi:MAG: peptidase, partial [Anaerolineae bacterium]|nr:peptidase [Anaerolineae bacterium]